MLAALGLAACMGPGGQAARRAPDAGPWQQALSPVGQVVQVELPATAAEFSFAPGSVLLLLVDGWRPPVLQLSDAQREGLRNFVQRGGRVLLFGYTAALAADFCETERPESAPFRWGFDRRTTRGHARLGWQVVSGRAPELFDGLAEGGAEHTFLITGGQPCCVPRCAWKVGVPQLGEVLGQVATELDGDLRATTAPVVVRWSLGAGQVLACGLQPDFANADAMLRSNSLRFAQNCVQWLQGGSHGPLLLCSLPPATVSAPTALPSTFDRRELPMQPLLAHWGWQAPIVSAALGSEPRRSEEIIDSVLLPSWLAGADLLELDACDREKGMPLPWSIRDPLKRPQSYRGDSFWPGWTAHTFAELGGEAHARGMLLQASLDPLPTGDKSAERLVGLRFLARELADVRRLGAGALDGFGLREWLSDTTGYGLAMLQDFHPGGYLYRAGEAMPEVGGSLAAVDAADGGMPGLTVAGTSAVWRDGFPGDLFPLGRLDARARAVRGAEQLGGGSFPDWIVTQANDFVRARIGLGGAMWWSANDPATLGRRTLEYVQGVSQEPLRAAVAMRLSATGSDGYRAAAAALIPGVQQGFGAEVPAPAAVHVLQNNWFSLLGSGGALLFDPTGQARFRIGEAIVVSPGFLRTRMFGGRPNADAVRSEDFDFLQSGTRGEGGYDQSADVGGPRPQDHLLPGVLAWNDAPRWPQQTTVELPASIGYHELQMSPRAVRGRGILTVSLDGALLHCEPFQEGQAMTPIVVPVHLAKSGLRMLQLAVAEGGAVAFDRLRLIRAGDVGAEARVLVPAGSTASLVEQSASSYHAERIEFVTLADFPAFLMRIRCERAVRNLQVERTMRFPAHGQLLTCAEGEDSKSLRGPFILRAPDSAQPDLMIVPLQLARYAHFTVRDGALLLVNAPEPGVESRIGIWLAPRDQSLRLLPVASKIFGALDQPQDLDLGDLGEASLMNDLPVAWTRLVHLVRSARTPYSVCENGWWTWRGAQPAEAGGDFLRVCMLPGDTVRISGGPGILARTRPGPGSLQTIALRDPQARSAIVRVLQPNRLVPPSVVMASDFDEAFLEGRPWAFFSGRTVFLPDRVGTYRLEVRSHSGGAAPHVTSTRAPLRECEYVPASRELVLFTDVDTARPFELPFTAVINGPLPSRVDNGEIVAEASLRHADAEARAAAAAGGVIIRFRSGVTKVHYGD